ncbi:MAG TPA: VOC family protein [Chitinophagaceae bacterium]|nr:VOC family protein [Chitinophagaceae bacterium]
MKRRKFLGLSASAGILAVLHAHTAFSSAGCLAAKKKAAGTARITALRLLTTASLPEMKKFYSETIGLPVISENMNELIIGAGETTIAFIKSGDETVRPFYHFAFNIPENKIQKAFEWQRKKTPVIHPNPAGTKDQVVNFNHWNAHSIFFLDPAGNLLEYIARHDLKNAAEGDFSAGDILYASEIGFIVDDVVASGNALQEGLNIGEYKATTPGFWPIGDETGLLLMIQKGRVWSGHPGQKNETTVFKTSVTIRSAVNKEWKFPDYPYELLPATNG